MYIEKKAATALFKKQKKRQDTDETRVK